ncbi:MAG: ABC transporter permease [Candidatus Hodarchaeales archaeon]
MFAPIFALYGMLLFILVIRVTIFNNSNTSNLINPITSIDIGLPLIISILSTFIIVNPIISNSIAREKEIRTLESLISLPISRYKVLSGKFLAGLLLAIPGILFIILMFISYIWVLNYFSSLTNNDFMAFLSPEKLIILSFTLFLCLIINLGIGIAFASLFNSAESSRQFFSIITLPIFLLLVLTLISGSPEALSQTLNFPLLMLLYLLPWMHAAAIIQKIYLQKYFIDNNYLLNPFGEIWIDILFHIIIIFIYICLILWVTSKFFDREGLIK